jgi:pantothenate kinase type III
MSITICFDFGNTRLKAAVFEGDQLKEIIILPDDNRSTIEERSFRNTSRSLPFFHRLSIIKLL